MSLCVDAKFSGERDFRDIRTSRGDAGMTMGWRGMLPIRRVGLSLEEVDALREMIPLLVPGGDTSCGKSGEKRYGENASGVTGNVCACKN